MSHSEGALASLHETLDDLAGRAMLVDDEPAGIAPLLAALSQLASHADVAGCTALSETALELSQDASDGDSLRQGLLQLQKVLESESKKAAEAAPVEDAASSGSLGSDPDRNSTR